jgi:hypothetical protein
LKSTEYRSQKSEFRRKAKKIPFLFWLLAPDSCILFEYFDCHIRANAPTEGAGRTFFGVVKKCKMIAFFVKFFREADRFLGTGDQAELASFAPVPVNDDFAHLPWILRVRLGHFFKGADGAISSAPWQILPPGAGLSHSAAATPTDVRE